MTWPEDGEMWRLLVICLYRSERRAAQARLPVLAQTSRLVKSAG
jgi:hypothetical protein